MSAGSKARQVRVAQRHLGIVGRRVAGVWMRLFGNDKQGWIRLWAACARSIVVAASLILGAVALGTPAAADPGRTDAAATKSDAQFRALFMTWKRLDQAEHGVMSVPSIKPVDNLTLTSFFGVRADPFRGTAAMHAGVDIPGAVGTPIYATADGIVGRAGWYGGYGNLVELEHGQGLQTRYGHLSRIMVAPGARVKRGDVIALMGSTGRSTGSHLHYEVRMDGRAVDPMPYLDTERYAVAMRQRVNAMTARLAQGGPEDLAPEQTGSAD
ncbi:peptidoglycan DD-metalloendopeptidase family protein [Sphingomonas changnyeongensis]|uniref:Peptidoglycan DD-metalloendopeptidase family protein n=1 Tax=Sphingomonas changnyeongensis TaxID=2698679 RepID=A0A7Z2NTL9_9SPHN|nr:peptidoglycan DD-metalloendopeptidase family protein [Sphingomonas changnyeongensis]